MTLYRSLGTPITENMVPEINTIVLGQETTKYYQFS